MQEIARHNIQGCTSYTKRDLDKMDCQQVTLRPGDVLYMPKGIVHYATTRANVSSTHLTVGIFRKGHTWRDVFDRQCHVTASDNSCQRLNKLLLEVSSTRAGLVWNDLAASPFEEETHAGICKQLNVLVSGDHPAALSKLLSKPVTKSNTYEQSARELLALLPDVTQCQRSKLVDLLHHAETHEVLTRARRSHSWTPPCRQSPLKCNSASGCDCDHGKRESMHCTFSVLTYCTCNYLQPSRL
jgi:ribosomal protein L16 Arg81 hydroxylase